MKTRSEFEKLAREMMEAEHLRRVAIVSGFDTVEFFSGEVAAKQAALLATYDEMAARIAELEATVAAMDRDMRDMAATSDGFQMDAMFARERINALVLRVILDSRVVLHRGAIQRAHDLLDGGEG